MATSSLSRTMKRVDLDDNDADADGDVDRHDDVDVDDDEDENGSSHSRARSINPSRGTSAASKRGINSGNASSDDENGECVEESNEQEPVIINTTQRRNGASATSGAPSGSASAAASIPGSGANSHQSSSSTLHRVTSKPGTAAPAEENAPREILVERTVIHEALLKNAVYKELRTIYDAAAVPAEPNIQLHNITTLCLSYRSIYAIDNLQGFESLTKLQLDNNIIDKISNLSHLVNLQWLDLSFNNITKIEGLDKLVNLTDLSLFDNKITTIEGIWNCTKLNVLSLGNNQISKMASLQVKELRKLKHLRLLNLKGNPVCSLDDYHNTLFAYLTNLKYLDYVLIEPAQFAKARDTKLDQLIILEQKERDLELLSRESTVQAQRTSLLASANLDGLHSLFNDMIRADVEHAKVKLLPGFDKIMANYKAAFDQVVNDFTEDILSRHAIKQHEHMLFQTAIDKINGDAEKESIAKINQYQALKKRVLNGPTPSSVPSSSRGAPASAPSSIESLTNLRTSLSTLTDTLMDIEMLLVEQMNTVIEEFAVTYQKLITDNVLKIATCFRSLMEVSSAHVSSVYDLSHRLLENFTKDENFTDDVDVKAILSDKDLLNNAISASHENQDAKILLKEDEIREREEGGCKILLRDIRKAEYNRNRKRVTEIYQLKAREEAHIDAKLEQDQELDQ